MRPRCLIAFTEGRLILCGGLLVTPSGVHPNDQSHAEEPGLILVDRSVWIDFLSSSPSSAGAELRRMIADAEPFALTGVVVTEILQGLKRDVSRLEHLSVAMGNART